LENILLRVGAKCDAVDLFKDSSNKPFVRIVSPPSLAKLFIEFDQAYFGGIVAQAHANVEKRNTDVWKYGNAVNDVFRLERKATEGLTAEIVYSNTACEPPPPQNSFNGNIVLIRRGGCSVVEKARMVQHAGAIGMVVINNEDSTVPLRSIEEANDINIWLMCIKQSTGHKIVSALENLQKVVMYLEEGGRVEKLLVKQLETSDPNSNGGLQLPELYLNGRRIGNEQTVADMYARKTLIPALERAGAFELPPGAPACRQKRLSRLRHSLGKWQLP
jgi:hypothetical protein